MTKPGSGQQVDDYLGLCEGDIDPFLNKRIRTLILKTQEFVVYLDDELFVEWGITGVEWDNDWDSVINEVSALEAEPVDGLADTQVESFRRMLAESVARVLDTGNVDEARAICERALSVASGFASRPVDSRTGRKLVLFDGFLRIVSGGLGAFFVALAIHARMFIAPLIDPSNQISAILLFGFVAGMSERRVPNLVSRFEQSATSDAETQHEKTVSSDGKESSREPN